MRVVYSPDHKRRDAKTELLDGQLVPPFEKPERVETILERVRETGLGEVTSPREFGLEPVLKIHDKAYVNFLQACWEEWVASGAKGEAIAACWPARRMQQRCPDAIDGKLGYYALAAETSITEGTWDAAIAAANVALEAADRLEAERAIFALGRPPGHHAARDMFGGYCFLNNAAIATQHLLDKGAARVAVLDVDFHHGNGTQDIFYKRSDVLFVSLHGRPQDAFPHFLGYADETGTGKGEGFNLNIPMAPGTKFNLWREGLQKGLNKIHEFGADALIVSLGTDTFEKDPISFFKLASDDFLTVGRDIAALKLPTIFVMEGGYALAEIGVNAVNVCQGFKER